MMTLQDPEGSPYTDRIKVPKYTGRIRVVDAPPRYFRRAFPSFGKAEHREAAEQHARGAGMIGPAYEAAVDAALKKYGAHGSLISGVFREHFPNEVKDWIRILIRRFEAAKAAAFAHYAASGARTPFQHTSLARTVGSAGRYGFHLTDAHGRVVAHARTKEAAHRATRRVNRAGTRVERSLAARFNSPYCTGTTGIRLWDGRRV